jgi:hypothetical protein
MIIIVATENSVRSSGMLRCVKRSTVTDVLEGPIVFETVQDTMGLESSATSPSEPEIS